MQVVGRACHVCHEKITMALGVSGCLRCNLAFHDRCVGSDANVDKGICPECGHSFSEQINQAEEQFKRRQTSRERQGRILIFGVLALLSCSVIAEVAYLIHQGASAGPAHFVRYLITGLLFAGVYSGQRWARLMLCILLGLGFLVGLILSTHMYDLLKMKSFVLYASTAVYGLSLLVILFVPSVGDYFHLKHRQRLESKKARS